MELNCQGCHQRLRVPDDAIGRRARCPACGHKFVIPAPHDYLEETISGWIVQEVCDMAAMRDRHRDIATEAGLPPEVRSEEPEHTAH